MRVLRRSVQKILGIKFVCVEMNPKFLSNDELLAAFADAKAAAVSGERITSWSSAGTSVSKQTRGIASNAAWTNAVVREISFRKYEQSIPAETLPEIAARPRPKGEAPAAFVN